MHFCKGKGKGEERRKIDIAWEWVREQECEKVAGYEKGRETEGNNIKEKDKKAEELLETKD